MTSSNKSFQPRAGYVFICGWRLWVPYDSVCKNKANFSLQIGINQSKNMRYLDNGHQPASYISFRISDAIRNMFYKTCLSEWLSEVYKFEWITYSLSPILRKASGLIFWILNMSTSARGCQRPILSSKGLKEHSLLNSWFLSSLYDHYTDLTRSVHLIMIPALTKRWQVVIRTSSQELDMSSFVDEGYESHTIQCVKIRRISPFR
jgi:hypothetical protein